MTVTGKKEAFKFGGFAMKILMIRWKSICEPDIMAAFLAAGQELTVWPHQVKDVDYDRDVPERPVTGCFYSTMRCMRSFGE